MATLKIAKDLFDLLYPVGTYYETSNSNWTPSNAGWYGTWVEDTAGKTTVAKDAGTFKTLGGSVGSENKTTGNHTLTVDEIPRHNHPFRVVKDVAGTDSNGILPKANNGQGNNYGWSSFGPLTGNNAIEYVGGDKAHNHGNINVIQPSIVVRRWHRTA